MVGLFTSDIFEKTIEFSRKYRDNDGYECVSDIFKWLVGR